MTRFCLKYYLRRPRRNVQYAQGMRWLALFLYQNTIDKLPFRQPIHLYIVIGQAAKEIVLWITDIAHFPGQGVNYIAM